MQATLFRRWLPLLAALAAGACLRLWFIYSFPQIQGDTLVYGDIAKNWLLHGIYGLTGYDAGVARIRPTLIRLPGYPAFLAVCFSLFSMEHYRAVLFVQTAIDLASACLTAGFVREVCSARAAAVALWLAVLCPFTANYVAMPLTETLSIFCVALALYAFARLMTPTHGRWASPRGRWVLLLAATCSYATLLRPDGALLGVVLFGAILGYGRRRFGTARAAQMAVACAAISLLPFVPWTVRNWRTFHVFEPLAPRYATDPGEFTAPGFQRWTKTWLADFASTYEIYWNANNDLLAINLLPQRAFDSRAQYEETRNLFSDYNSGTTMTHALDARFASLAAERVHASPLRFYLGLPLLRVADMWLRPRVEMLNIELRWWQYNHHPGETLFAIAYGALNLAYIVLAAIGVARRPPLTAAMLAFLVVRTLLLATLEAPESRYTLEFFPVLIAFAAAALSRCTAASISAPSTSALSWSPAVSLSETHPG